VDESLPVVESFIWVPSVFETVEIFVPEPIVMSPEIDDELVEFESEEISELT
jgi:hypothetical protein